MKPTDKKIFESLTDWQLMGLCIEREASGEPYEGKIAIGTVILERVDHRNWDGCTIQEVILKPWQFSWTMEQAGKDYYNTSVQIATHWIDAYRKRLVLQECCQIANGMIQGTIPRDPDLAAVHCCQYLNPHASEEAAKTKLKWLASGMRLAKVIGHHEFFQEV
jgi:hypothetical protein